MKIGALEFFPGNRQLLMKFFFQAYEKAAREQRMRAEISQAKKEANFYLENVSKGKAITAIVEKKRKKRKLPEEVSCLSLFT